MLSLAKLFCDGIVFQRRQPIRIWGWAAPLTMIRASFADQTACTRTNGAGRFQLEFPAMEAGGPWKLRVDDGTSSITVHDVLIGEVWLASGQSNMEYPLGARWAAAKPDVPVEITQKVSIEQYQQFVENLPAGKQLRFFTVKKQITGCEEDDVSGENWQIADRETVSKTSAVALWFGLSLQKYFGNDIPIGLIVSAWGGTVAEAWSSYRALAEHPATAKMAMDARTAFSQKKTWDVPADENNLSKLQKCCPQLTENAGLKQGWAENDFDDREWRTMELPGSWICQNISGNGVLWARKRIFLSKGTKGPLLLSLGAIDKQDITYFNGVEIGRSGKDRFDTDVWDKPRIYTIPADLVREGENVIAVRAYSFMSDGAFLGTAENYNLKMPEDPAFSVSLSGDWKVQPEADWGYINLQLPDLPVLYSPHNPNTPGILYGSMIHPLQRFGIRGVIWYQGESNAFIPSQAAAYAERLESMITDWRSQWELGDFPFIQVQLAGYTEAHPHDLYSSLAVLREQQEIVCKHLPCVYLASAVDLGEALDLHPQNKRGIGERLAKIAEASVYENSNLPCIEPVCMKAVLENASIRLYFRTASKLSLDSTVLMSFQIANENGKFFPAEKAVWDDSCLLLSTSMVPKPTAIRYAWAENPLIALRDATDLPVLPFHFDLTK